MKRLALSVSLSLVTAIAAGATFASTPSRPSLQQPQGAPATPPAATPSQTATSVDVIAQSILSGFGADGRSDAAVAKANAVVAEIAKAYRELPTLTDTMTLTIDVMGKVDTITFAVALGKGSDARLAMQGATMVALDGQMTLIADEPSDRALRLPLKGDLMNTLREALPNFAPPVTILDLRAGRPLTSEALGLLALRNPRLAGYREDQKRAHLLVLGDNGASQVSVDAGTRLILESHALFTPPDAPAGFVMDVKVTHENAVADSLGAPLMVHIGDRRIVTSLEDFMPTARMIAPGEVVPAWSMRSLEGTTVSLADLRGSVVVIDFWASYCAPCKRAMPYVDEFAKWAAQSGKPIKVFAVNTLESGDADARIAEATTWWRAQKFSLTCLMDIDDGVSESMGIRVLPTTLVIDPNGVLSSVLQSFDAARPGKTVDDLKEAVEKALAPKG
jgi:thiol-disulfide isomerase/thioredoxin